jgi:excisionase family DNA binding protein
MRDDDDGAAQALDFDHEVDQQDVFTVEEAARFLRIGRNQMYAAIMRREVPHARIGRTIRLSRTAIVRWLERSCGAASNKGKV